MAYLSPFRARDLFAFNAVNLDHWTETYSLSFYLSYLAVWPDLSFTQRAPAGGLMGYVIGKAEGKDGERGAEKERHGHVTAITVAPGYRRLGVAQGLMRLLERGSAGVYQAYFIDLFVRPSNTVAVGMYEGLGYEVYRVVRGYYAGGGPQGGDEDGFDMRKAMPRDAKRETVRDGKRGRKVHIEPEQTYFEPARRPRP